MISTAAAQPLPAASAPPRAASSPAPQAVTVPATPAYNAITVQLQQVEKPDKPLYADTTFWAAIVPAVALLVTIWNTNKQLNAGREALDKQLAAGQESQNRQLAAEHERERLDRITKARQEIYAQILSDYQKVQALLGGLADTDPDNELNLAEIAGMSASINKLWVWGEVESAYQVREFYSQVNEFAWSALAKAEAIRKLRRKWRNVNESMPASSAEHQRVTKQLEEHNSMLAEVREDDLWKQVEAALKGELKRLQQNFMEATRTTRELGIAIATKRDLYWHFIIEGQNKLMTQVNKVMAQARADVGLQGDVSRLEQQSKEMSDRAREAVTRMRSELDEEIKDFGFVPDSVVAGQT